MMMSQLSHHTRDDCCSLLSTLKTLSQINWQFPQECDNFMHKQNRPFFTTHRKQDEEWMTEVLSVVALKFHRPPDGYFVSFTKHNGAKTFKFVQLFFRVCESLKDTRKTANCQNCQKEKRKKNEQSIRLNFMSTVHFVFSPICPLYAMLPPNTQEEKRAISQILC